MQKSILFILLSLFALQISAQELNCVVKVNAPNLQTADPKIFKTLENDLYEFMSNRKWTDTEMALEERIDCTINISITEESAANIFKARLTIQSNRPVFNSGYNSITFNFVDNIQFSYTEFQPLEFNENTYLQEITAVMAFYAYMILGFDNDSFAQMGGTPYFQKAQNVVNSAQTSGVSDGWQAFDGGNRTRYWLNDQLLDSKFAKCREAFYIYHRKGLDQMHDNPQLARMEMMRAMRMIGQIQQEYPNIMLNTQFMDAKNEELVGVFKDSSVPPQERTRATNAFTKLDPSRASLYNQIRDSAIGGKPGRPSAFPSNGKSGTPGNRPVRPVDKGDKKGG